MKNGSHSATKSLGGERERMKGGRAGEREREISVAQLGFRKCSGLLVDDG